MVHVCHQTTSRDFPQLHGCMTALFRQRLVIICTQELLQVGCVYQAKQRQQTLLDINNRICISLDLRENRESLFVLRYVRAQGAFLIVPHGCQGGNVVEHVLIHFVIVDPVQHHATHLLQAHLHHVVGQVRGRHLHHVHGDVLRGDGGGGRHQLEALKSLGGGVQLGLAKHGAHDVLAGVLLVDVRDRGVRLPCGGMEDGHHEHEALVHRLARPEGLHDGLQQLGCLHVHRQPATLRLRERALSPHHVLRARDDL
mmetsp:Transcript_34927/g.66725  ORF Transcript_34927/g.66725 Transcript_34927/m.66725 type:complete len:255 (-) Transcript_34927:142-906(-)